ncbi:electron transfer flavoprotein subunit alpha/FixB family protein [Clostridiaceae bacterium M8S5]|nr:electron transfer flavoprotein subunit alpha/FixB family protein [Clostridiaceae bacterium M8S5]
MSLAEYKGVFVFAEQREGVLQKVSLELISKARELANKLEVDVTGVILGKDIKNLAKTLIHYGADKVIYVDDKALETYITEPYTKALVKVIDENKPEIFLIGATTIGRDLAPRVSARIHTGLTADCTVLDIDEENKNLLMTRPAFGGNIMATIVCPDHRPQMSTVRPGVMTLAKKDESKVGKIDEMKIQFTTDDLNIEILEIVKETKEKINIEDANVLISGGRGIGKAENFEQLKILASKLDGQVSASRAVVDAGWIDRNHQVGQTGKTVRPDLYVACGISGAIQHVTGMEDSELIVAINKDEQAPIFEFCDIGIVGDANKVLPALINELELVGK